MTLISNSCAVRLLGQSLLGGVRRIDQLQLLIQGSSVRITRRSNGRIVEGHSASLRRIGKLSAAIRRAMGPDGLVDSKEVEGSCRELGSEIWPDCLDAVRECDAIEVRASNGLLHVPIEMIFCGQVPVSVAVPVVWVYPSGRCAKRPFENASSAMIISDITADPDRACLSAAHGFDHVVYVDDMSASDGVLRLGVSADVVLFSLHGTVSDSGSGRMQFGERSLRPNHVARLCPWLAYFDSCRMALGRNFLRALAECECGYCIAPFVSNEAGDSSTRAMLAFFEKLLAGMSPEVTMHHVREELWSHYSSLPIAQRAWKALPFRIYRFD